MGPTRSSAPSSSVSRPPTHLVSFSCHRLSEADMPSLHATRSSPLTTVASESHYLTAEGDLTIPLQTSQPGGHYASCQALTLFTPGGGPTFRATQASRQGQRAPQGEPVPPSVPMQKPGSIVPDKSEDRRDSMPTERKSMWRTAEERRMSDLTRVMEWLERRRGKKLSLVQPQPQPQPQAQPQPQPQPKPKPPKKHTKAPWVPRKAAGKEAKKVKVTVKNEREKSRQVTFSEQGKPGGRRDADQATFRRLYGTDQKGKRQSTVPGNYSKESIGKSELEMKDSAATETTPRMMSLHHQSMTDSTLQDSIFGGRKSTLLRDWVGKLPDTAYERRLKSLMEKGGEPKVEAMRALKPEEVLSCRYLRLSKNNIRTLLKLCTDAGLVVDIHPHMVEAEIDAKKALLCVSHLGGPGRSKGPCRPCRHGPVLEQLPTGVRSPGPSGPCKQLRSIPAARGPRESF